LKENHTVKNVVYMKEAIKRQRGGREKDGHESFGKEPYQHKTHAWQCEIQHLTLPGKKLVSTSINKPPEI